MSAARPLDGQRVVITRAAHQIESFTRVFAAAGAEIIHLPLLEVIPPDDPDALRRAAERLGHHDWLLFTSANAVDAFLPGVPLPLPARTRIAVVGPATAQAVRQQGFTPALRAATSRAEGLLDELAPRIAKQRVLIPQADDARPFLADGLRAAGAVVETLVAYRKSSPAESARRISTVLDTTRPCWVTLTSPRIARHFIALVEETKTLRCHLISIGPVTSNELRRLGREPDAEAAMPTAEAMLQAILNADLQAR